jgi:hypothetical protein
VTAAKPAAPAPPPARANAPAPAPQPTPAPAPQPTPPPTITLALTTDPAGAAVAIDGEPQDLSAGSVVLPRDDRDHKLVATAPGHVAVTRTLRADRDASIAIVLAPEVVARRPASRRHRAAVSSRSPAPSPAAVAPAPTPTATTSPNGSPIESNL